MYFIEFNKNGYFVKAERIVVDDSFGHAFGIEIAYYYEVKDLEIFDAFDEYGEGIPFDNTDKDLIYDLTQLLENMFNEKIN